MTTYSYPTLSRAPDSMTVDFVSNTASYISPITGATQTIDRGGERLIIRVTYSHLKNADRGILMGFLAKLNGQQHRVNLPYHAINNRGAFGGTPVVNGADQTGTSINIRGGSDGITNWIRAGDIFSFNGEMKICTADANTSSASPGGGTATISFYPRIRTSPADATSIETTAPTGVFMLESSRNSWSHRPGAFTDFTLTFIEDIT